MIEQTSTPSLQREVTELDHTASVPTRRARSRIESRAVDWLRVHGPLTALLSISAVLRLFRLGEVAGQLIGDECWYVQDARVILGLPVLLRNLPAAPLSGLDPNSEHPPLAKLIMAGSMKLFGGTEIAWRIPSVVLGVLSIFLVHQIVLRLGGSGRQALFAAFLLAFDNLFFIHGRIAMLDIYVTAFILLATWLYLGSMFELAGVVFGLAALCKINGLFGLGGMLLYDLLRARRSLLKPSWPAVRPRLLAVGFCAAFFLLGLGALDCYWTEFRSPFAHLSHMFQYHTGLKHVGPSEGNESTPLQWWLNSGAFNYFNWTVRTAGTTQLTLFRAAMNEYVIFAAPVALFYAGQRAWKVQSKLGTFAFTAFLANFGPMFLAWAIVSRKSYIFYMVPTLPAIACAIALLGTRLPRSLQLAYGAAVLYAFFFNFPFRYF